MLFNKWWSTTPNACTCHLMRSKSLSSCWEGTSPPMGADGCHHHGAAEHCRPSKMQEWLSWLLQSQLSQLMLEHNIVHYGRVALQVVSDHTQSNMICVAQFISPSWIGQSRNETCVQKQQQGGVDQTVLYLQVRGACTQVLMCVPTVSLCWLVMERW
jgi:hypothetical protein